LTHATAASCPLWNLSARVGWVYNHTGTAHAFDSLTQLELRDTG
jgi:hypothetical protein